MLKKLFVLVLASVLISGSAFGQSAIWQTTNRNGGQAAEAINRSLRVVNAWYTKTGNNNLLLPRQLTERIWNGNDTACDMWPYFAIAAYIGGDATMQAKVRGTLTDSIRKTNRVGHMVDDYDIDTNKYDRTNVNLADIIFGAAEEVKDGMTPLVDVTGEKVYLERGRNLLRDVMANARTQTKYGLLPDDSAEVNGDMLEALCRFYGATGDPDLKMWAERIGDAWINQVFPKCNGMPCHHFDFTNNVILQDHLNISDHGNEIIVGLVELLYMESIYDRARYNTYLPPIKGMIDKLLDHARDSDGIWLGSIRPSDYKILGSSRFMDTWGYCMNSVYQIYKLTGNTYYRDQTRKAMHTIATKAQYMDWGTIMDNYSDAIESGILLYNREPMPEMADWLDRITPKLMAWQRADGICDGTYLDGNYVRTVLMWAMMKTAGTRVLNWRNDLKLGAAVDSGKLYVQLSAGQAWQGLLCFDGPRYHENSGLMVDYPRINQFPQWYTIQPDALYNVLVNGRAMPTMLGQDLIDGLPLSAGPASAYVIVWPKAK